MLWMYIVVLIFTILTLFNVYTEYKKNNFSKKSFYFVFITEFIVIILLAILLINSL